jgi:hypothetical protein
MSSRLATTRIQNPALAAAATPAVEAAVAAGEIPASIGCETTGSAASVRLVSLRLNGKTWRQRGQVTLSGFSGRRAATTCREKPQWGQVKSIA